MREKRSAAERRLQVSDAGRMLSFEKIIYSSKAPSHMREVSQITGWMSSSTTPPPLLCPPDARRIHDEAIYLSTHFLNPSRKYPSIQPAPIHQSIHPSTATPIRRLRFSSLSLTSIHLWFTHRVFTTISHRSPPLGNTRVSFQGELRLYKIYFMKEAKRQ
ncbi:hypothetical protein ECG_07791 [Echinococcus granulosus]|uniref:Uncharacterized protein n=1 Tax=Echinococcus granulosus TaxID=6210 RepID=A0A068WXD7_ECHGR|nr:hypothetical protein ECG_07791 [Echinococcus granulosus]CDS22332.1 hypothetical protein EgrG_002029700 [Echinococcus granulosus]